MRNHLITYRKGIDIAKRFGQLTVIGKPFWTRMERGTHAKAVVCECRCGRVVVCSCGKLSYGFTRSCGECAANDSYYVYQFRNRVNGKRYIGSTSNPKNRERQHRSGYGSSRLHWAILEHGNANLEFKILRKVHGANEAAEVENRLIEKYKTRAPQGYNT